MTIWRLQPEFQGPARALSVLPYEPPQALDFFHQFERQRGAGRIDTQITLKADGDMQPLYPLLVEAPLSMLAVSRLDHAFGHQLDNGLFLNPAYPAHLRQGHDVMLAQHASCQFTMSHCQAPIDLRGLKGISLAMVRYSSRAFSECAGGQTI